jgi:AraC-like DNA-binding protein
MVFMPHILPHPALQPYVKNYLLLQVNLKGVPQNERIKPIPPDADQSLYFYPRDKVYAITNRTNDSRLSAHSIFVAQQTSRVNIQFGEDHVIIQVCFRPGFIHQLLGKVNVNEFQGKEIDAACFSDEGMRILNEQLRETADLHAMIGLIDRYLLHRLSKMKPELLPIDKVIACLKYTENPPSIDWLASQACLSNRQFERKFTERMGMSPKFYTRIARFDRAFKLKLQRPDMEWINVAYNCGYFDFSHLMRDFRQFAEVTPSMLLIENSLSPDSNIWC